MAAQAILLHDIPAADADHWDSLLEFHSIGALWSDQSHAARQDIPSAYVVCELHRVIGSGWLEMMIKNAKEVQQRVFDVVERLQRWHEPVLSKLREMAGAVVRAADRGGGW